MRDVFHDISYQQSFEKNGYVVVDALTNEQCEQMIQQYNSLNGSEMTGFESTMNNPSPAYKKEVFKIITEFTDKVSSRYLNNYSSVTANYVIKRPDKQNIVPAHRDWTMCDENEYIGVNIWIALDDCNILNGALHIMPGSNSTSNTYRGNMIPTDDENEFMHHIDQFVPFYIKRGQAVIYDLRCLHFSPPNNTKYIRFAAGCACIPSEARPIHYIKEEDNSISVYEAPPSFYLNYSYGINKVPGSAILIDKKEKIENITPHYTPGMKQIFKDPGHQSEYEKNGYILIDFLQPNEVSEILNSFNTSTQWFKNGFMSSVYAEPKGYKEYADKILEPFGNRIVSEFMNDYRIVIGTFMVKGEGEESAMYPHQDWTLVDENKYASFNIWIPLVDTNYNNGALSIMRGGHKLPFTVRGSNVPDALTDKSLFTPETLTYLPMKAGQALIYDHRCIHVSPPNKSGSLRPAIAIGAVPKGIDVFHYFYDKDKQTLRQYKADKQFYFNHVATQFTSPENAELIAEMPAPGFHAFTKQELDPVFKIQLPRKKSIWKKIFNLS